jgi:hypothetical protein
VDESAQAKWYAGLVGLVACDPSVSALHFFHLIDESNLDRFQSGLFRLDDSPRPAADAVKTAIDAGCAKSPTSWHHIATVIGAHAEKGISNGRRAVELSADEDYTYTVVVTAGAKKARASGKGKAYWDTNAIVPPGFAGGTAKVTMKAWANPSRSNAFTIHL